jgi:hypothetical protein
LKENEEVVVASKLEDFNQILKKGEENTKRQGQDRRE